MVAEDFLSNSTLNIVGIVIAAVLPLIIIRYFAHMDKKRDVKEAKIAQELKEKQENIARDLKIANAEIAEAVKRHADINDGELLHNITELKEDLQYNSKRIDEIALKQELMSKEQNVIVMGLQTRADLTNGNIEKIRNDLMDLQDTIDVVSTKLHENIIPTVASKAALVQKKRKRARKRKQIDEDAINQDLAKQNIGSNNK